MVGRGARLLVGYLSRASLPSEDLSPVAGAQGTGPHSRPIALPAAQCHNSLRAPRLVSGAHFRSPRCLIPRADKGLLRLDRLPGRFLLPGA
jgi:hypothetical protein